MSRSHRIARNGRTVLDPPVLEGVPPSPSDVEALTRQIGSALLRAARGHRGGPFSLRLWSGRTMNWAMRDPTFKVNLFRFVDAYPMLHGAAQVHDYLTDYLGQPGVVLPAGIDLGLRVGSLAKGMLAHALHNRIQAMAANFIAGADVAAALPKLRQLWKAGMAFSADLLGEACVSDDEAHAYQRQYLDLIETLAEQTPSWPANAVLEQDVLGPVPRANVSIKLSALGAHTDPIDFEGSVRRLLEALRPILVAARQHGVLVNFDMEQSASKDLTIGLFERCCEETDFPAGIALQAYLRSGEDDARRLIAWARRTGRQVTVRLIKGAYWDYEVIYAERMGWPVPVWTSKRDTDACFERMAAQFVAAAPRRPGEGGVKLAVGSHNVRSIAYALAQLQKHDRPESALEIHMLYGMAEPMKAAAVERGLRLRQYAPIGKMVPGMAYLVRRLLENASNQSWLRANFAENAPDEELLASPHTAAMTSDAADALGITQMPEQHELSPAIAGLGDGRPFLNEPLHDFAQQDQREQFAQAVATARVPAVVGDATLPQAEEAVARAAAAFPAWRDKDALARAAIFVAAAGRMRERRDLLAGLIIREVGKTWRDADAEVCEAIDYCEYYARHAVELLRPRRLARFVGEWNRTWHEARGVAVVISPWNFPLAICTGMTVAALVAGNTAVVKPSPRSPGAAQAMCDLLWESGVPADVLQLLPGGPAPGAALVRDPRVAIVAFTGSKRVGLDILEAAGRAPDGQPLVKRVVCEMGGKNAIIVDESADLDEAVPGVRQSAFGYSGQKCSACSRAIVVDAVYEAFLRRLVEATRTLVIGDPRDAGADVGPVIDEEAARSIREYIEIGKGAGRLELACEVPAGIAERVGKPYIGPHIFSGIEPHHRLANEEIFGPVLSVMRVSTFEQALEWANATTYKLTGGVFSRKPSHLELAQREFRVGNLYLNRGITGALVGRQPFGGLGLSGAGTQAGGAEYLLHFVDPRSSCENTMRHGFAPGLDS